jgi:hypothetical protein
MSPHLSLPDGYQPSTTSQSWFPRSRFRETLEKCLRPLCSCASVAPHNYFRIIVSMVTLGWQTTHPEFRRSSPGKSINSAFTEIGISPVQRDGQ